MATPVVRSQRQTSQRLHRAARALHRNRELGQLIGAGSHASVKLQPEPDSAKSGPAPASSGKLSIRGFVC
jgi:hypothetical protein